MREVTESDALLQGLELFRLSPAHRHYSVDDVYTYLQLPIKYGNIRLYYEDAKPVALVTWVWLKPDDAQHFLSDAYHPTEEDYSIDFNNEGRELWVMELIAPYGHAKQVVRSISQTSEDRYGNTQVHWRRFHSRDKRRTKRF